MDQDPISVLRREIQRVFEGWNETLPLSAKKLRGFKVREKPLREVCRPVKSEGAETPLQPNVLGHKGICVCALCNAVRHLEKAGKASRVTSATQDVHMANAQVNEDSRSAHGLNSLEQSQSFTEMRTVASSHAKTRTRVIRSETKLADGSTLISTEEEVTTQSVTHTTEVAVRAAFSTIHTCAHQRVISNYRNVQISMKRPPHIRRLFDDMRVEHLVRVFFAEICRDPKYAPRPQVDFEDLISMELQAALTDQSFCPPTDPSDALYAIERQMNEFLWASGISKRDGAVNQCPVAIETLAVQGNIFALRIKEIIDSENPILFNGFGSLFPPQIPDLDPNLSPAVPRLPSSNLSAKHFPEPNSESMLRPLVRSYKLDEDRDFNAFVHEFLDAKYPLNRKLIEDIFNALALALSPCLKNQPSCHPIDAIWNEGERIERLSVPNFTKFELSMHTRTVRCTIESPSPFATAMDATNPGWRSHPSMARYHLVGQNFTGGLKIPASNVHAFNI